jgi:hypothetical protein
VITVNRDAVAVIGRSTDPGGRKINRSADAKTARPADDAAAASPYVRLRQLSKEHAQ